MVLHGRGVRCNDDMPRFILCECDVLEEASKQCSYVATDLDTDTMLA